MYFSKDLSSHQKENPMAISFNAIPGTNRVPLCYVEFDSSNAVSGTPANPYRVMVLGQKFAAGTYPALAPVRITSADQALRLFGIGSQLGAMFAALKKADAYTETWAIALDDSEAGQKATATITLSGTTAKSGTLYLYIAGHSVPCKVVAGEELSAIASRLATAINAELTLPASAVAAEKVVTLTCKWAGLTGNDLDLRLNVYGEDTPGGLTVALTGFTGGTANPDIASALAVLGDEQWHTLVVPFTDTANRRALEDELNLRWGPLKQMESFAFMAFRGTHGETATYGNSGNSQLVTCMGTGLSPTPPYIWAAVNAVIATASLEIDPARPLQTLALPGIIPPGLESRWTMEERNLLLHDGIATFMVQSGDVVAIERQITMYQTNVWDMPDPSYLDLNTPATLGYIRYATRSRILQKFPRHKLASDGTRFGPGQAMVTPSVLRAELLVLYRELEEAGIVEDFDTFKKNLLVERNANDRNRVDVLMPPDLVNQFRMLAVLNQFIV